MLKHGRALALAVLAATACQGVVIVSTQHTAGADAERMQRMAKAADARSAMWDEVNQKLRQHTERRWTEALLEVEPVQLAEPQVLELDFEGATARAGMRPQYTVAGRPEQLEYG